MDSDLTLIKALATTLKLQTDSLKEKGEFQ